MLGHRIVDRAAILTLASVTLWTSPSASQAFPGEKPIENNASHAKPTSTTQSSTDAPDNQYSGTIMLPASGEYTWWVASIPGKKPQPPRFIKTDRIEWTAPSVPAGSPPEYVFILNNASGRVAKVDAAKASKNVQLRLVESDFSIVHKLQIKVISKDGKPVRVASVTLKDKTGTIQERLIDDSSKGTAEFDDVLSGDVSITAGSGDNSVTKNIKVETSLKDKVGYAEIILDGNVPTLAPTDQPKTTRGQRAKPEVQSTPTSGALTALLSLLCLAAIASAVFMMVKNKNMARSMKAMLEAAGVPLADNRSPIVPEPKAPTVPPLDPNEVGPVPTSIPSTPVHTSAVSSETGPRLVGIAGTYAGAVFPLNHTPIILGRESTNEISLSDDTTASRRHARITRTNGTIVIYDEGSSNGTFVNGQKIVEHELKTGDEVQVGSTRFRYEG